MIKHVNIHYVSRALAVVILAFVLCSVTPLSASAHIHANLKNNTHLTPHLEPLPAKCYGSRCYGLDPYQTDSAHDNCIRYGVQMRRTPIYSDYKNPSSTLLGYIYNEYSVNCNANWAVIVFNGNGYGNYQISIVTTDAHAYTETQCYPESCSSGPITGPTPSWTNMVDGTNLTMAFAWVPSNGGGEEECDM